MGKSWKEKPGKYRNNKDFQKKQQKKHGKRPSKEGEMGYPPSEFIPESDFDSSIGGLNDYAHGM